LSYLIETSLPLLHRDWDINDMVGADNLEEVQDKVITYINDSNVLIKGNNLYIYSTENGTGKTRVANFIVSKLHEPRLNSEGVIDVAPFAIVSFGEYLKLCLDRDEKAARKLCLTAPILLLDDVSPAFGTANVQSDRRELLLLTKYRREHLLLTIVTSNLTPEAFQNLYGTTASSKVLENFSYIEVRGGDVRQLMYPDQLNEEKE
jgi:DNA replication protein DnaC